MESAATAGVLGLAAARAAAAQVPGDRPRQAPEIAVLNPGTRVPVGLIIDDSTCLVNLNRFAMPQFDEAFGGSNKVYARDWKAVAGRDPRQLRAPLRHVVRGARRQGEVLDRSVSRRASDASIAACPAGAGASSTTAWRWCGR